MAAQRSHSDRSLKVKCEVLQELEKGASQKDLAQKYAIPPNTISTSYEKGLNSKRIKPEVFEAINKALVKWLLKLRSENIPVNCAQLGVPNFQASDRLLEKWKKR